MKRLLIGSAMLVIHGCGFRASDALTPVWEATIEACYQRQLSAIEDASSREDAELAVARIRSKCDDAYRGLRASGDLLEVSLPEQEEE